MPFCRLQSTKQIQALVFFSDTEGDVTEQYNFLTYVAKAERKKVKVLNNPQIGISSFWITQTSLGRAQCRALVATSVVENFSTTEKAKGAIFSKSEVNGRKANHFQGHPGWRWKIRQAAVCWSTENGTCRPGRGSVGISRTGDFCMIGQWSRPKPAPGLLWPEYVQARLPLPDPAWGEDTITV